MRAERMSAEFIKYHVGAPLPFPAVFHHFTAPDRDGPHDHPWAFRSTILSGRYVEAIYSIEPDGRWEMEVIEREAGSCHHVPADRIHRIIDLPDGDCWTLILPQPAIRKTKFWDFSGGRARWRFWDSDRWYDYEAGA